MGAGQGSGAWSYHPVGSAPGPDYALSFDLRIDLPSSRDEPVTEGTTYTAYYNDQYLGGYEAAAVLRKSDGQPGSGLATQMYRFMFSNQWQEVLLWSSRGGILAVRPFPFAQGRTYHVQAGASGGHLTLQIDGQKVLDTWDATMPISAGEAALGRLDGQTWFGPATLRGLAPPAETAPQHQPGFSLRTWKGLHWGFDGDEPIFLLGDQASALEIKLMPGYPAQLYMPWYMQNQAGDEFHFDTLKALDVKEQGARLVFTMTSVDQTFRKDLTGRTTLTLTYDAAARVYRYDFLSELVVPDGSRVSVTYPLDLTDAGFHAAVASASTYGEKWPQTHRWSVYQQLSGPLYKEPFNHAGWYPGYGGSEWNLARANSLRADGGFWAVVGDPMVNPVLQLTDQPGREDFTGSMCAWGYDLHLSWMPGAGMASTLGAGTYSFRWRLTSASGAQADGWLKQAGYATPGDLHATWLLYTGGVGHVETFDKVVSQASPFGEYPWGSGALQDGTVGRTDHSSLRLDGPDLAGTVAGGSQFMEPFADDTDYEVSAWVKTQNVVGEGPGILFSDKVYYPRITGTHDWQRIGFVVRPQAPVDSVPFGLHNSGSGSVWFDDFQMRPVTREHPVDSGPGIASGPRPLADPADQRPDVMLLWSGAAIGDERTVLDRSGHGLHGALRGAGWVQEQGHQVMSFDGKTAQVVMRGHPSVDFGRAVSLSLWFKPGAQNQYWSKFAGGGQRDFDDWQVALAGTDTTFGLRVSAQGGVRIYGDSVVPQDAWAHLLLVQDGDQMHVYLNNRLLGDGTMQGSWLGRSDLGNLRLGAGTVNGQPESAFAGRIIRPRVYQRPFTAADVATEFAAGPFAD